jgi:hypothetical protein
MNLSLYFSNAPALNNIGDFATTALLPNTAGAVAPYVGMTNLAQWDQATVLGVPYTCDSPTAGSAVWFKTPPVRNPLGPRRVAVLSAAAALTPAPGTELVVITYAAGNATITLSTVLAGMPIGTEIVIQKSNTSASTVIVQPDPGAAINGGVADAAMTMEGSSAVSSTTTSDDAWRLRRISATAWRASNC